MINITKGEYLLENYIITTPAYDLTFP